MLICSFFELAVWAKSELRIILVYFSFKLLDDKSSLVIEESLINKKTFSFEDALVRLVTL